MRMRIRSLVIIYFICLFNSFSSLSQNLILNNGFESDTALPSLPGHWYFCDGWSSVNNYPGVYPTYYPYASPDYFSTLSTGGFCNLPNTFNGLVFPYSGNAIMGIIAWVSNPADYREYLSSQLTSPLVPGASYTFSFHMTNGTQPSNQYGTNNIGIVLSTTPLSQGTHEPIINVTPVFEMTSVVFDTAWQTITFQFTAYSAYNYFTIGNFHDDLSTDTSKFLFTSPVMEAYYFLDEFSLMQSGPSANFQFSVNSICEGSCITIINSSQGGDSWKWYFPGSSLDSSDQQNPGTICYPLAGIYPVTLVVTNSSGSNTITQQIIVNPSPVSAFSSSDSIVETGTSVWFTNQSENDSIIRWQFPDGVSSSDSVTSHVFTTEGQHAVCLIATSASGCTDTLCKSFEIISPGIFIPNVITPNSDNLNDFFHIQNLQLFPNSQLEIFNRWGNLMYIDRDYRNDYSFEKHPGGVYYYSLLLSNGKNYHGTITVIHAN